MRRDFDTGLVEAVRTGTSREMSDPYESIFVHVVTKAMVPMIQIFAFYVITHGHYSPGGGFQGGVMLAASTILLRLALGRDESFRRFPPDWGALLAGGGTLLFAILGVIPLFFGGNFLDYHYVPIPGVDPVGLRYWGILLAEVFIGFLVWGALVAIYDALSGGGR